jgi:hypothetical protein
MAAMSGIDPDGLVYSRRTICNERTAPPMAATDLIAMLRSQQSQSPAMVPPDPLDLDPAPQPPTDPEPAPFDPGPWLYVTDPVDLPAAVATFADAPALELHMETTPPDGWQPSDETAEALAAAQTPETAGTGE